jgi:opacity protein-like surface antigen
VHSRKVVFLVLKIVQSDSVVRFSLHTFAPNFKQINNMKKLILSAAAVLAFGFANAQDVDGGSKGFAKGDVFLTGAFGYGSNETGNNKETNFTVAPSAAIMLSDNIALGAEITYNSQKAENGFADTADNSMFGFGVYGRYYFTPANDFSLFAQLGVGYATGEDKINNMDVDGFGVEFAPGINYFVSEHFALQATWGVLSYTTMDIDGTSSDSFNFGVNLSDINFGLVYKF